MKRFKKFSNVKSQTTFYTFDYRQNLLHKLHIFAYLSSCLKKFFKFLSLVSESIIKYMIIRTIKNPVSITTVISGEVL